MFCVVREIDLQRCSYTLADVRTQESIWPYRKYVSIVGIGKTIDPRFAYLRVIGTRSFPSEQPGKPRVIEKAPAHAPRNGSSKLVQRTAGGFRDEETRGVLVSDQHLDDLFYRFC